MIWIGTRDKEKKRDVDIDVKGVDMSVKARIKCGIGMALLLILWMPALTGAYAAEVTADETSGYVIWTDSKIKSEFESGGGTQIRLDATGMEEAYGYLSVSGPLNTRGRLRNADGIRISGTITASDPFSFTVSLTDRQGRSAALRTDGTYAWKRERGTYLYRLTEAYVEAEGCVEGELLIPAETFDAEADFDWGSLASFQIGIVQKKGSSMTITAGSIEPLPEEENILKGIEAARIIGVEETALPVHGEAVERYETDADGYILRFSEEAEGIHFSEGRLILTEEAKASVITLEAVSEEGFIVTKEIRITEPLRNTVDYVPDFPSPEEVPPVVIPAAELCDEKVWNTVRALAAFLCALVLAVCYVYYRKALREWKESE